jgi:hypothetical protein
MDEKRKLSIEDIAAHQKLALVYTEELPPQVTGIVDDRSEPTYIAVNSAQPTFEQHAFIGYAIGSYHLPRHYAARPPWFQSLLNRKWKTHYMRLWMRGTRRFFHRRLGRHKQSEIFALSLLITLGYQEDLRLYLDKHPDMTGWAICLTLIMIARVLKQRLVRFLKRLFALTPALP